MGASARPLKTTVSVSGAKAGALQRALCLNTKMMKTEKEIEKNKLKHERVRRRGQMTRVPETAKVMKASMKLKSLHVIDMSGPEGQEKVRVMLARRSCKQPYSGMYVGETKVIVLWDTGCTLPGLMEHSRFMQLRKAQPESVDEVVWYKNKQPVSGISEPPALMLGQAVITLLQGDRYIKVLVCILQNGDTGKAGILVGNQLMWSDHWGGCVDCDASLMRIRSADDGQGELDIPIDWALNYAKVSTAVAEQSHRAYCCTLRIRQDEEIVARHEALRVNTAMAVTPDTRVRLAVASKHRVVLLPKQPTVVLCAGRVNAGSGGGSR